MARPFTKKEREALKKDYLEIYEKNKGLQYTTCDKIGISQETLCNWRENDPEFAQAIKDIDERVGEAVIGKLMESIERGDRSSIYFYLKCKRHWSETHKVEVEQKGVLDVEAAIKEMKEELKNTDC